MTPEQQKLLDGILEQAHGLAENQQERDAIVELTCAVMKQHDALRWRTTQEITTASGADGMVFVRERDKSGQFWFDTCHIDELHEGDEWLPVPP